MPRYCFTDSEDNTIIRVFPSDNIPDSFKLGGKVFKRDLRAEWNGSKHVAGTYPFASTAAGVSPEQVPEIMKIDALNGVKTEYTKDGDPIFTSSKHRNKYLKAHGMIDRSAWY